VAVIGYICFMLSSVSITVNYTFSLHDALPISLLELALACVRVARVAPASERGSAVLHALVSVPLRWGGILLGPVAMLRVVSGIWLDRRFRWRRNAHRGSRQRGARP